MNEIASTLRQARQKTGFRPTEFPALLGLPEVRVRALEAGAAVATPLELDAYATFFGLTVDALAAGAADSSPITNMLMRAKRESGGGSVVSLSNLRGLRVLGEFARGVRIHHSLSDSAPSDVVDVMSLVDRGRYAFGGRSAAVLAQRAATDARAALGLTPDQPIPSMRALMRDAGILLVFTNPDALPLDLDGCSLAAPRPAVLVNLVVSPHHWWRTRMTLAHELGHLLLDHQRGDRSLAIVSPRRRLRAHKKAWSFFDGYSEVEARANAFAAHFIAPGDAVRNVVQGADPTSNAAIDNVCQRFGVGRVTAINRLDHSFNLGESVRARMERRSASEVHGLDHPDVVLPAEVGILSGEVRAQILEAVAGRKLSPVRAREYLRLELTEPLPEHPGLDDGLRAPIRSTTAEVCRLAQRHLDARNEDRIAIEATPVSGGWNVATGSITSYTEPATDVRPTLQVSYDLRTVAAL